MVRVTYQAVLTTLILPVAVLAISVSNLYADEPPLSATPYMGGPVELVKAPNGAIANKRILDGIEVVAWVKPTIKQPVEGIWVFGGYGLAPIFIIDTDEGLIAFDTGDTKHDGEILLEAIRTVTDKPIRAIIYGHSHTAFGAGVVAEGQDDLRHLVRLPDYLKEVPNNLENYGEISSYPPAIYYQSVGWYDNDAAHLAPGAAWAKVYLNAVPIDELFKSGEITVTTGDAVDAARVLNVFDRYDPARAVVIPPSSLVQGHM